MKTIIKILATIIVTVLAWAANELSMAALNQPDTALVLVGILCIVLSISIWCRIVSLLWNIGPRLKSLFERISHDS